MRNPPLCRYCSPPQPLDFRSAAVLVVYIAFFGIAIRFFVIGRHVLAYVITFGIFLILVGYLLRRDLRAFRG